MRYQQLTEYEIQDNQTGLVWRRDPEPGVYTFDEALSEASRVAEETGQPWRVPTVGELTSLLDYSRTCPASTFPDMPSWGFWSSSPHVGNANVAWGVEFDDGYVRYSYRDNTGAVRLVRGG